MRDVFWDGADKVGGGRIAKCAVVAEEQSRKVVVKDGHLVTAVAWVNNVVNKPQGGNFGVLDENKSAVDVIHIGVRLFVVVLYRLLAQ